jgi:dTDP-4-amino-4,6-dideoxygalactose transaminase
MLSVASALSQRVLSLPIYPELSDSEVEYVTDQVLKNV